MRTVTVNYDVYKFNELSESAKETVKRWYLDNQDTFIFTEDVKQDLYNLFGKNNLDVQYSLAYCQGDGFNIYGSIDAESIFNCLEKHNGGTQLAKFENMLTEKEKKTILNYSKECYMIELPMNRHYCYSLADYIDILEDWSWKLENYSYYKNINTETLKKFEKLVRGIFSELCSCYEKWGYEFFYEISDEDLEEICEANEWEFTEDGTIF
jgi:hypothetical protein